MKHKLIFFQRHDCGGLADMIKGASTVWFLSHKLNRDFAIEFNHELNLLYPALKMKPHSKQVLQLNCIDKQNSDEIFETIQKSADPEILICANGCLDHFRKQDNYLKEVLPFFQKFQTEQLPIQRVRIDEPFQVLHCRMGDVQLRETNNRRDNRIGSIDNFQKRLDIFLRVFSGMRTLVCCDNKKNLEELLKLIPNSFSVCKQPYHFSYVSYVLPISEKINSIEDTLKEHELMSRGQKIIMMAQSGFPIIAALIGGVKELILLDENEANGWKEQKSVWVEKN